ncbi:MAG TPA: zinc ABC transporter substrate-binding protein, partial [Gemmatales bacterium]|nr:zinc ABC transporter substrate-binding protein [Gemmatales bacterium]
MIRCITILFLLLHLGCQGDLQSSRPTTSTGLHVVCTTGMVADLARNIAGSHLQISQLMKAGVDPHLYKATPSDVQLLSHADLILYSGHHLEGKLAEVLHQLQKTRKCVGVTEHIPAEKLLRTSEGVVDAHLWFDVSLWKLAAQEVLKQLQALDPAH